MNKCFTSSADHLTYVYSELLKLSIEKQLAFLASLCERLLPVYNVFFGECSWGNPQVPREALDKVWAKAMGTSLSMEEITLLREKCKQASPVSLDSEDNISDCESANYALDISLILDSILLFCKTFDADIIQNVCKIPFNIIDQYSQLHDEDWPMFNREDPDFWDKVWNSHPLFVKEQEKQLYDLQLLSHSNILDAQLIQQLKESSFESPIFALKLVHRNNSSSHYH